MDIGTALIIMGIFNLVGIIIILELRDRSWFKKENFKIQKSNLLQTNKLKIAQMRREMGLPATTAPGGNNPLTNMISGAISDYIGGKSETPTGESSGGGMVENLLKGFFESEAGQAIAEKFIEKAMGSQKPEFPFEQT